MEKNYYLHKDNKTGEIMYLEYNKIKGYPITPKTKLEDAIEVNKIVFVNPGLREKLIRKKIDIKIKYLLKVLDTIETSGGDEGTIQQALMDSERLRINILHYYTKYLGNTFGSYSIQKINLITNQLKMRLFNLTLRRKMIDAYNQNLLNAYNQELYYLDEEETKKGRGGR